MRVFLCLGLIFSLLTVAPVEARASEIDLIEVDRRIQKLMRRPEMVGLAVAIIEDGELVFARGYGVKSSLKPQDKITPDTVLHDF